MKRSRMMMIPFIIMFIWGVFLIMRPRQQVQVTKVVETFKKERVKGQNHPERIKQFHMLLLRWTITVKRQR